MGYIYCVGIGPGATSHLTKEAMDALIASSVIVGYKTYVELISPIIGEREVIATGMMKEVERAKIAVELAQDGKVVAVVSSGDSGIYGMAGLVIEVINELGIELAQDKIGLRVIPGIPAFVAAASLLGAPLVHDFCAISLSDLLTPWKVIEKRLRSAGEGDFVVALYNPRSKKRDWQLQSALAILGEYRDEKTPVGLVKRAMRQGETVEICHLSNVPIEKVDMESILIVGNSNTFKVGPFMVTPRGYFEKYSLKHD